MQQSPNEPSPKLASQDAEQPDGKIIRFTPRPRIGPERSPEPMPDEDDDPGPGAA